MDRLGDPLALPGRDREGLRGHARRREAGGEGVPRPPVHRARRCSRRAGLASARGGRRPRDAGAAGQPAGRRDSATSSTDLGMPGAGTDSAVHASGLRAPQAFERPRAQDRRAARPADRDPRPGRQVGRDAHAQGKGGPGLDRGRACSTRERNRATRFRSPASWPRSARRSGPPASWNRRPSA